MSAASLPGMAFSRSALSLGLTGKFFFGLRLLPPSLSPRLLITERKRKGWRKEGKEIEEEEESVIRKKRRGREKVTPLRPSPYVYTPNLITEKHLALVLRERVPIKQILLLLCCQDNDYCLSLLLFYSFRYHSFPFPLSVWWFNPTMRPFPLP